MSATTITTRAQGGIVPAVPGDRSQVARPARWLLVHHTGPSGWPAPGFTDREHMQRLQSYSSSAGKTWEYNYVITYPTGVIWEQAGDYRAAHCQGANDWSFGVQINQAADAGHPPQTIVDSFRWLRAHLVATGRLTPDHQCVPHYRLRATQCSGPDLAEMPHGSWNSPTGEGALGNVIPELLAPWVILPFPPGDDVTEAEALLVAGRAWGDVTAVPTAATVTAARAAALAKVAETLIPNFDGKPSQWRNYVVATNKNADDVVKDVSTLDAKVQGIIDALTQPSTPEIAALIAALRPVIADEVRKALAATSLTVPAE